MIEVFRKLWFLLSPSERWQLVILVGAMIIAAGLEMVGLAAIPAFALLLTDPSSVLEHERGRAVLNWLTIEPGEDLALYGAVGLVVLFLAKNAYLAGLSYAQVRFAKSRTAVLHERLFSAYMLSPYVFHLQRSPAELLHITANEAHRVGSGVLMPALFLAKEAVVVAAIVTLLFLVDPLVSLLGFVTLGSAAGLFYWGVRRKMAAFGRQEQQYRLTFIQALTHGLGVIRDAKILGREQYFIRTFSLSTQRTAEAARFSDFVSSLPRLFLETVAVVGLVGVAGIFVLQGREFASLLPMLTLFTVAVVRMIPSFNQITTSFAQFSYGRSAVGVVHGELRRMESQREPKGLPSAVAGAFQHSIELRDLHFGYPDAAEDVLKGISLEIPRGAAVGFVGSTGAGKTTLVNVILGLLTPTRGEMLIDGRPVLFEKWRRHLGYVSQDVYLCDDTIRRNIALGLPDHEISEEAMRRAVRAARLDEFIDSLPEGLDTVVGDRGVRLSGGQRQRVGIARALYHDPAVLVLDEATSSLDNETERYVMEAIEQLRGERTLIIIAHRLSTVRECDTLFFLKDGRVAALGGYAELLRTSAEFRRMATVAEGETPLVPR